MTFVLVGAALAFSALGLVGLGLLVGVRHVRKGPPGEPDGPSPVRAG